MEESKTIQIEKLIRTLREIEAELQRVTGGQIDAVAAERGAPYLLREAQERLLASEAAQRRLADSLVVETRKLHESQEVANVGSWETDLATMETAWTPETYRIFEVAPDQFHPTHERFLECVHPDDRERVRGAFLESFGREGPFRLEHRVLQPDGRTKHLEERWQTFSDAAGKPIRAVGTCQDVTSRVLAEDVVRLRSRQQEALARISLEVTRATTLETVFDLATRQVADALRMEFCKVLQLSPDGVHLRLVSGMGWNPGLVGVATVGVDLESQAGFTLATKGAVLVNDFRLENRFSAPPLLRDHGVMSGLSVAIELRGKPWGVLGAHSRSRRQFNGDDQQFMDSVAALLSVVIERLAVERSLGESERRVREAQRIAHLGNWEHNLNDGRLIWSEEVHRIFGTLPDSFWPTYESFIALVHPDDRAAVVEAQRLALEGDGVLEIDHRILHPRGEVRHVRERGELIRDEAGRPQLMAGTVLDITERARSEAERDRLFNLSLDMFAVASFDGRIEQANPAWTACLGWSAEELAAKPWVEFVHPDDRELASQGERKLSLGESLRDFELRYLHKDGSVRWLSWSAHPLMESRQIFAVGRDITEARRREEQLRLLETCVRHLNDIVLITEAEPVDEPGPRILYVNDAFVRRTGFTREEAIGKTPRILQGPKTQRAALDRIRTALKEWRPVREELINYTKAGEEFWLELEVVPVADATGWHTHWIAIERDITERRRAEQTLRESEERHRLMIEGSEQVLFYTHDREHIFQYLSPSTSKVLGYEPEELVGRPCSTLVISDDPENADVDGETERAMREGVPTKPYHAAVRHKNGARIVLEIMESPILREGVVVGIQGFARDITERKSVEVALRESESRFRTMANAVPQLAWIAEADGGLSWYNERWYDYTGAAEGATHGWGWQEVQHPEHLAAVVARWRESLDSGRPFEMEFPIRRRDGVFRAFLTRAVPIPGPDGKPAQWFGTCTDVEDLKRAEVEVLRSNRSLKMLSACNESLIRADEIGKLLQSICSIAVDIGGYQSAWVGFAMEDAAKTIIPMTRAGRDGGLLDSITLSWDEGQPGGQGMPGQVVRGGKYLMANDLSENNLSGPWLNAARSLGYRGVVCLPLRDDHRTFGVLVLSRAGPLEANEEEAGLLNELADDLAFGIVTLRGRAERRRLQEAVMAISRGVSASIGKEFFEQVTLHMVRALHADGGLIARLDGEDAAMARTLAVHLDGVFGENLAYPLAGTPCQEVVAGEVCVHTHSVQSLFPDDPMLARLNLQAYAGIPLVNSSGGCVGFMAVLFRQPLEDGHFVASTLQIFAARAAAELERQRVDAQLAEQASLLEKATDAIFVRDLDSRIVFWNRSAERVYGWSREEALGRASLELLDPDRAAHDAAMRHLLGRGEWVGELAKHNKAGQQLFLDCRWTLVRDADGNPASVLCIESDITAKKKLEAQFLRAQRMESIGTLAGGIAHDLNNVLAPILMSLEVLRLDAPESGETKSILDTLQSSAQHGAELVKQVLSFARGVDGKKINVNVAHLLGDIRKLIQDTFPKNISFEMETARDTWQVMGDPTQISQVFTNLCVNARDAMPNGGRLSIRLENVVLDETYSAMNPESLPGSYLSVQVSDNGSGIPSATQARIFEPFFTTKEVGKGTGLGLSTTLAIVRSHGGFINLYSELGKGSKFKVYLPAIVGEKASEVVAVERTGLPRGAGERVLVVDDEAAIRTITQSTLQRFGYEVLLAANGAEAVSIYALNRETIALVLTDMAMPIMDGPALIMALRSINPRVKIIGSSGNTSNGGVAKAVGAGVKHFVSKPYTAETLLTTLRKVLMED